MCYFAKNDEFLSKSLSALLLGDDLFLHVFDKKVIFLKTLLSSEKSFSLCWFRVEIVVDFSVENTYVYWKFMFCVFWKKISDRLSMHILTVLMKKCEKKTKKYTFFTKYIIFEEIPLDRKNLKMSKSIYFKNSSSQQ